MNSIRSSTNVVASTLLFLLLLAVVRGASAASPSSTLGVNSTHQACRGCPKGSIMTPYCFGDPCNLEKNGASNEDTQRDPWACRCVFAQPTEAQEEVSDSDEDSCRGCPMFYELNFWCMNDPCNLKLKKNIPDNFQCKCRMQTPVLVVLILSASLLLITIVTCVIYRIRSQQCCCCGDSSSSTIRPRGEEIDMKPIVVMGSVPNPSSSPSSTDIAVPSSNIYTYYAALVGQKHHEEGDTAQKTVSPISSSSSTTTSSNEEAIIMTNRSVSSFSVSSSSAPQHSRRCSSISTSSIPDSFDSEEFPLRIAEDEEEEEGGDDKKEFSFVDSASLPHHHEAYYSPTYQPPTLDQ